MDYVNRLITLHEVRGTNDFLPNAIFGSVGTLRQSIQASETYRIGVWPAISETEPASALGLMVCLAYLLDSLVDVRAYILYAQPTATDVKLPQYGIEDWGLDDLHENVALEGRLTTEADAWTFALHVENDLVNDDDPDSVFDLSYSASSLAGLVEQLVPMALDILTRLGMERVRYDVFSESVVSAESDLKQFFEILARWQVDLTLTLLDVPFEGLDEQLERLLTAGKALKNDFGAWAVASAVAHALLPGYEAITLTTSQESHIITELNAYPFAAVYIGNAIFILGEVLQAYVYLEKAVKDHPKSLSAWMMLADTYRRGGRLPEMIDAFQRAIEEDLQDEAIYRNYGAVLELLGEDRLLAQVVFIEPEDYEDRLTTWEALAAYDKGLEFAPESLNLLQRKAILMLDVMEDVADPDELSQTLRKLIELDASGEYVRGVVEQLSLVEDVEPFLDVLEVAAEKTPERVDRRINLAMAYLMSDDYELAAEELDEARELTDDEDILADIDRLYLVATDPEFENRIAEIEAQIDGGASIDDNDIRFLRAIMDRAPALAEAFILLAKAYYVREAWGDALDVLIDAYTEHSDDVEVLLLLGRVLWQLDDAETAFKYLQEGLTINGNYVPLLATVGLYLFEDEQEEAARVYLSRAEAISPRDPVLGRVRRQIAEMIANKRD